MTRIYRPQTVNLGVQWFKTETRINDAMNKEQDMIILLRQVPLHCRLTLLQTTISFKRYYSTLAKQQQLLLLLLVLLKQLQLEGTHRVQTHIVLL